MRRKSEILVVPHWALVPRFKLQALKLDQEVVMIMPKLR